MEAREKVGKGFEGTAGEGEEMEVVQGAEGNKCQGQDEAHERETAFDWRTAEGTR